MATTTNTLGPDSDFNTSIPDKEERKNLRRKRIEKRYATNDSSLLESHDSKDGQQKTGLQQVSESLYHLDKRKIAGIQDVTSFRVVADEIESKRRVLDEKMRHERLTKLQHEALSSAKANAAIEMKWAELLENEIPQELHADIQSQMVSCAAIVKSKDNLINEFLMQLRAKDEEYVRSLRQQAEDVETLLTNIRKEFHAMQQEYEQELDAIEDVYLEEREKLITDHTNEVDALFESRKNREIHYKETKQKREEQYHKEIESLITKGADQYNKLKIELEMNIQTLKQQLEEIRATYQLNTEKLDYNYRVLTELDVEKTAELSRYKRRLTKLKDQLNHFASKYNQINTADAKTNNELTEDYRRLTQKYKDLQAKFRHFEIADTQKFDEVWGMHEDEAKDLIDQLLKADKVISEQVLGWKWKAPEQLPFHNPKGFLAQSQAMHAGDHTNTQPETVDKSGKNSDTNKVSNALNTISGSRIRSVLKMLAQEAGFLALQPEVQEGLDNVGDGNATLTQAETMLRALGIKSEEKIMSFIQYFFKDATQGYLIELEKKEPEIEIDVDEEGNPIYDAMSSEEAKVDELKLKYPNEELSDLVQLINPESMLTAIRTFMDDVNGDDLGSSSRMNKSTAGGEDGIGIKKKLNNITNYWSQLSQIVSDESVEVWKQLEKDCVNYKDILVKRASSLAEVDELTNKNVELKRLLNQYLGDRSNDYFCIPPAQTMKVRPLENVKPSGGGGGLGATATLGKKHTIGGQKKLMSKTG